MMEYYFDADNVIIKILENVFMDWYVMIQNMQIVEDVKMNELKYIPEKTYSNIYS
jgi:hypothetical protein